MEPSLVCTPGSDELVELTNVTTQSVMYRKKILKWVGEMLHINCCISVPNIAGSIHVWTTQLLLKSENNTCYLLSSCLLTNWGIRWGMIDIAKKVANTQIPTMALPLYLLGKFRPQTTRQNSAVHRLSPLIPLDICWKNYWGVKSSKTVHNLNMLFTCTISTMCDDVWSTWNY